MHEAENAAAILAAHDALARIEEAVRCVDVHAVDELVAADPRVASRQLDDEGTTALHLACTRPNAVDSERCVALVRLLLDHGADVHARTADGSLAMHLAVQHGCCDVVAILVKAGADWETTSVHGLTPLHYAISHSRLEVLQLLDNAKYAQNWDEAEHLKQIPLLYWAVCCRELECAQYLLDRTPPMDINRTCFRRLTPLARAAQQGSVEFVKLLLAYGADPNIAGTSASPPLIQAIREGNREIVALLVEAGATVCSPTPLRDSPLVVAAGKGDLEIVRMLLQAGVDVNQLDDMGNAPLHLAVENGHTAAAEYLLAHAYCDITSRRTLSHMEAIHIAAKGGNTAMLDLLVRFGARVDVSSALVATPLFLAMLYGHADAAKQLIAYEADAASSNRP